VSKRTNTPIGEVDCPHKGCDQVCKVYVFRPRSPGALTIDGKPRKTVFSGKHYAECSIHGRIGSDGNPAVTNYILTEGKIWGPARGSAAAPEKRAEKSPAAHAPPRKNSDQLPRKTPGRTPEHPKPAPEQTSKRKWWETVI
jgi:hypothetical protein